MLTARPIAEFNAFIRLAVAEIAARIIRNPDIGKRIVDISQRNDRVVPEEFVNESTHRVRFREIQRARKNVGVSVPRKSPKPDRNISVTKRIHREDEGAIRTAMLFRWH
ncbi:MAG: hypothetical protein Rhob2KO_43540 [Rhodopirellula baltica]